MAIEKLVFYIFATVAIMAASMVIISKNPVRAVLCLVLTFFASAGIWMLLEAEFLSIILVLVYVGAVMVLFLFVIMMMDIELVTLKQGFARFLPLGISISALVIISLIYAIGTKNFGMAQITSPESLTLETNNVKILGTLLYTDYLYPFEIAGILLLVAIIAAISLTFRGKRNRKMQEPSLQVAVKKEDRVRLVKINKVNS